MKKTYFAKIVALLFLAGSPCLLKAQTDTVTVSKLTEISLEDLMNMKVITASGSPQKLIEAPSTMIVITAQQILERGYVQLEDAMRDVPGVDMIHINGYVPTLYYFRGMYGAENLRALLMVDGIPENNIIGSNDMAGPAYSLHNTERIEIIWGPASALYGANAFGGVINIITKKGKDINGFHYEKEFGSFNTSADRVMLGMTKSNFDISLSGSVYSTDGPKFTNRDPDYTASYVDRAWSFNGAISYSFKKLKATLAYRAYETPMGWGTFFNSPTVLLGLPPQGYQNTGVLGLLAEDVRGEKSGLEQPYARTPYLELDFNPNEKLSLSVRGIYRETGIDEDSYAYITIDGKKLYRIPTTSYSNRTKEEVFGNYILNEHHQFSAGVQYYQDNVERGSRGYTVDTTTVYLLDGRDTVYNLHSTFLHREFDIRNHFGSYFQYVLSTNLLRKTNFTLGARYDYDSYYSTPVTPRFAIVNQPNDKLTLKLLYGNAFRAPTNTEISQAGGFELTTEKIQTYEANIIYNLSKKFLVQVNGFHNGLTDAVSQALLTSTTPDKNPVSQTINGIEARLDMLYSKSLSGFANFTYQHGTGKNNVTGASGNIPGIASQKGNAGITLRAKDLLTFTLIGNWIGTREVPRTDPYGRVDGYFLTHVVFTTAKLFDNHISASIRIQNLFDVTWLDPGFRTADGFIYSTVLEQPGRTMMFKVMLDLN